MTIEKRYQPAELRAKGRRLEGYAALFGTLAHIGAGIDEKIAPGAFAESLATRQDILALVDHDPSRVLARTRSGTLRLSEDSQGLAFDLDLPDTQAARDVLALAERGDLGGMSFGFTATRDDVIGGTRTLHAVELFEISVVAAWPAYEGTTVQARAAALDFPNLASAARALQIAELTL